MRGRQSIEVYSPREIADAAGVHESLVHRELLRRRLSTQFVDHRRAVDIGRALRHGTVHRPGLFSLVAEHTGAKPPALPLVLSSTLHACMIAAAVVLTGMSMMPAAAASGSTPDLHLVFVADPGPGGGGGGGGAKTPAPARVTRHRGRQMPATPVPAMQPPAPAQLPSPPLEADLFPSLVAPLAPRAADAANRTGVLNDERPHEQTSLGSGTEGGAGAGQGDGLGSGDGSGVGPGAGGGFGGGPFRPGAGIEPPRLIHEVKAAYTDSARRAALEGDVVLEVVVLRDGSVGQVRLLRQLGGGLDETAANAVRRWRFEPATRGGSAVDVIVEIAVEFRLR